MFIFFFMFRNGSEIRVGYGLIVLGKIRGGGYFGIEGR